MSKSTSPDRFPISPDDPLAEEHRLVAQWIEDAEKSLQGRHYSWGIELNSLPSGKKLLDAKAAQGRRIVLAAIAQSRYWHERAKEVEGAAGEETARPNRHDLPGWARMWCRSGHAEMVIRSLLRRSLPLNQQDLLAILAWSDACNSVPGVSVPVGYVVKSLERYVTKNDIDEELRQAMRDYAGQLRASYDKEVSRYAAVVEQLCANGEEAADDAPAQEAKLPPPEPAPAGMPGVLVQLKRKLGMLPSDKRLETTLIGPDGFALVEGSPLRDQHDLLSALLEEVVGTPGYHSPNLTQLDAGRVILAQEPAEMGRCALAAVERHVASLLTSSVNYDEVAVWQSQYAAAGIVPQLLRCNFSLPREGMFDLLLYVALRPAHEQFEFESALGEFLSQVEREVEQSPLSEGERYVLSRFRASRITGPTLGNPPQEVVRLTRLIGDGAEYWLAPGEVWADTLNEDIARLDAAGRRSWSALISHLLTATSARPSGKWLKTATKLVDNVGAESLLEQMKRWLPLVSQGQSLGKLGAYFGDTRGAADTMQDENATCLRGLLWLVKILPQGDQLVREFTSVALSAYKKVPGVGPRAVKVGNAAVYALSELSTEGAVGQLAMLKVRVKFGTAQKEIEKAFNKAAEALGLPRDEIEEMGVPSYGLVEADGLRRETLGDYRVELRVSGSDAKLHWFDPKGKALKSVPAKVRKEHKDDLKDLQQSLKDIQGMLPAQRDRIDSMLLLERSWPIDKWRGRYLEHPLVGTIARRLIWCVDGTPALFLDGRPTDVRGEQIEHGKTAEITLWHPVGREIDEITAWRERLEALDVTQPFKQAHREVYLLTDAERRTGTYSNRFAAHVLRQHQFNALCAARGWKNRLRLMVDDSYAPPSKELAQWGLRAEYWVEGIGDGYGTDTNDSGVYLRLATDQVRFYAIDAAENYAHASGGGYGSVAAGPGQDNVNEPLPLERIPALVFSEIMRDVDLFVGIASVGNDPTWQDGGPEGRYREYWHNYSFGELSGTASTRKQVLQRLVPRLKIADQCSFTDRFLVVRGKKRTYKIHLGSGNILMEPNDQYLCIVPDSRARVQKDDLFLPFEGDNTLSIIISKALLLAEDAKIKDATITRQIDGY